MATSTVTPRRRLDYPSYRAPGAGGPGQYAPDMQTGDPYNMIQDDRRVIYDRGNRIDQDLRDTTQYRDSEEDRYGAAADSAYDNLMDMPGYTSEEAAGIQRTEQYGALPTSQGDIDAMYQTDAERAAAEGDTNSYYGWYDPAQQESIDRDSAQWQRNEYRGGVGRMDTATDVQDAAMQGATDPTRLRLDAGYGGQQMDAVGGMESNVRGAIDPTKLSLSERFQGRYPMSDEDVELRATEGAQRVGNQYRSAIGELQQSALEAGNASPMAVAAARARLDRQSASDAALTSLSLKNAARQEQAQREKDLESMRLDAEGGQAGLKTNAELTLGGQRIGVGQDVEGRRIAAEQGYTDRAVDVAARTGAARRGIGEFTGTQGVGMEAGIGGQMADTQRYITDRGTDIAMDKDAANVDRARYGYEARRGTQQYGNDTRFGQGLDVTDRQAAGSQTVADARRAGEGEYRGYVADSRNTQAGLGSDARGQRIQNYGTQAGATNDATGTMAQYDLARRGQSFGTNFKSNFGASLGKSYGSGTFGKK